ncbi:GntR family transcriptional regulator [Acinetobacter radioresistens]|nr:GntR family transcriptional regulator [Acinetobacter radioresistens]
MNNNEFLQRVKNGLKHSSERQLTLKVFQVIKNFLQESDYIQEFKFPSSRFLSESLGISRDTIEKAYELLENEKLVYRVKGKGTFSIPSQIPRTIQEESNFSLPEQLIQLETLFFDQNLDFFADGMPEVRNFPFKKWYDTEKLALEQNGLNIF